MALSRQLHLSFDRLHIVPLQACILSALLVVAAGPASAGVFPSIGGAPTEVDEDLFSSPDGDWDVVVYSYAFVGVDAADDVPVGLPDPVEGQTLFAYVPDMSDLATAGVDQFQVGNPFGSPISVAGHSETILPTPGFVEEDRQNPSGTQVSLPALSVTYLYNGDHSFGAGEFSVLYFLTDAIPGQVPATIRGGASVIDEQSVLGPIPEPATGMMLLGGVLYALSGKRRTGLLHGRGSASRR